MKEFALQLNISLEGSEPLIWRQVVVNANIGLEDLHYIIQTVMPWDDSHMHKFYNKAQTYMMPYEESSFLEEQRQIEAYERAVLGDVLKRKRQRLQYEYDFGDCWVHNIVVESTTLPPIEDERDAIFIDGENAAPPEDCGGIWGYERLIEILSDPTHSEYEEMAEWLCLEDGESFDPTDMDFTSEEFNKMLNGSGTLDDEALITLQDLLEDDDIFDFIDEEMLERVKQEEKRRN